MWSQAGACGSLTARTGPGSPQPIVTGPGIGALGTPLTL